MGPAVASEKENHRFLSINAGESALNVDERAVKAAEANLISAADIRPTFSFWIDMTAMNSGNALLERFRDGDADAFAEVYRQNHKALYGAAYALLGDPELAMEAVQYCFIRAWSAVSTFDPRRAVRPWLYAILRRCAIDTFRRNARALQIEELDEAYPSVYYNDALERAWTAFQVRQAIQQLPTDEQAVVVLAYQIGMSHSQVAATLKIPIGTVKSRLFRAHRKLAELLRVHVTEVAP
ncbi:RNA polymerase sigma factor [Catellatospora sp. NPDC049609]|uniref:RNA polymerase sigma factor n=1 Tax=Catellatospora sp. NPDC049609 TaxID=3155505 RepID=UPI00343834BC